MKRGKKNARRRRPRGPATRAVRANTRGARTTRKVAVSLEKGLADAIEAAAARENGGNVSGWLAEAARERLRLNAMREALAAYEATHGVITEQQMAEADRLWPRG
jgi:hypothetical protein